MQQEIQLFESGLAATPLRIQLLKWVGNKQRHAPLIVRYFPESYGTYFEPFLGSGGVLGALAPNRAIASDIFKPLMDIWFTLKNDPDELVGWYEERLYRYLAGPSLTVYDEIKHSYNRNPNGADLLFLSRACYGGVVRFRSADGFFTTPMGAHRPIPASAFQRRVELWSERLISTSFFLMDFETALDYAEAGDLVYCDPPYQHSQTILYGAQSFDLHRLFAAIERCRSRGVYVALSIDGTKKSGDILCGLPIPKGLFKREIFIDIGRSMLKRFQMVGQTLENEEVTDRLLLTY